MDFHHFPTFCKISLVFAWGSRPASPARAWPQAAGRGREGVGIGPQGRHSVLRHSGEARGTIVIDRDGPESHQALLN